MSMTRFKYFAVSSETEALTMQVNVTNKYSEQTLIVSYLFFCAYGYGRHPILLLS